MKTNIKLNGKTYNVASPNSVGQGQMDAYILKLLGHYPSFNTDQCIGFAMLEFNLFYDDAKPMVEKAISSIEGR